MPPGAVLLAPMLSITCGQRHVDSRRRRLDTLPSGSLRVVRGLPTICERYSKGSYVIQDVNV